MKNKQYITVLLSDVHYNYTNNLREMTNKNNHHFTHKMLTEMKDGTFNDEYLFEVMPAVKSILHLDEAYQSFSTFMEALNTDEQSLQSPSNAIRQVYEGFVSGEPQHWRLIDPVEYGAAINALTHGVAGSDKAGLHHKTEEHFQGKVNQWEDMIKYNIQQLAANSYLTSGPTLDPRDYNENGENLLNLLWYNLSGDDTIPYKREDLNRLRADGDFIKKYWKPFIDYIGTKFGDDTETYETDAPLEGMFNYVAEFDKNKMDTRQDITTLNKLVDLVHGRGSLSHLFIRGGDKGLDNIAGFDKKSVNLQPPSHFDKNFDKQNDYVEEDVPDFSDWER
ncbi:MAG: hypothetical protein LBK96_02710 [Prevotellaceae bacterium]|jgi:hypothetical protein|nr:hypothetical protein [Prevotellaceae bacterium]